MNRLLISIGILSILCGAGIYSTVQIGQAKADFERIFADTDDLSVTLADTERFWQDESCYLHFLMDRESLDEINAGLARVTALKESGLDPEAESELEHLRVLISDTLENELPTPDNLF